MKFGVLLLEEREEKKRKCTVGVIVKIPFYAELLTRKLILRPDPDLGFMIPLVSQAQQL